MGKKFKEVSPWYTLNVQIMFHEILNGAWLGKLMWKGGIYHVKSHSLALEHGSNVEAVLKTTYPRVSVL